MAVDYLSTLAGLILFSIVRYFVVPAISLRYPSIPVFLRSGGVENTLLFCPLFMLLLYYVSGYYVRVIAKPRVVEFLRTLTSVAIAAIIFFLVVLLNDILPRRRYNYEMILLFFSVLFPVVYIPRFILTTWLRNRHRLRPLSDYLLITSSPRPAAEISRSDRIGADYHFRIAAICNLYTATDTPSPASVPAISSDNIESYIRANGIRGVVLSPGALDSAGIMHILSRLFPIGIPVMLSPDEQAIVTGQVRFDTVTAEPLTDLTAPALPDSFIAIKRAMDITVSGIGLILLSPLMLILAATVKLGSPGPVIYSQERVGLHRRPFRIYKFRSMKADSEPEGLPRLSTDSDPRVTTTGRWMRKYRLDELPNLWNVLKGDMSLVGPRPERQYFIDEICRTAPHYTLLHLVRPGLTSWGMVRYGYASDVPSMIERLKYDILYIQNLSLGVDLRILFHTVSTVLRGEGK